MHPVFTLVDLPLILWEREPWNRVLHSCGNATSKSPRGAQASSQRVRLVSGFQHGTPQWYPLVVPLSGTLQWYPSLVPLSRAPQWYPSVVPLSGTPQWYPSVVPLSGTPQSCPLVVPLSGTPQWYSSVVPRNGFQHGTPQWCCGSFTTRLGAFPLDSSGFRCRGVDFPLHPCSSHSAAVLCLRAPSMQLRFSVGAALSRNDPPAPPQVRRDGLALPCHSRKFLRCHKGMLMWTTGSARCLVVRICYCWSEPGRDGLCVSWLWTPRLSGNEPQSTACSASHQVMRKAPTQRC